jgi:hypothetical protein
MPQLFPRWANAAMLATLGMIAVVVVAVPVGLAAWVRSPNATGRLAPVPQPVPFAHVLHAGAFHIDCRYCHASVERSAWAGMPPTNTCVPCHDDAWLASAAMAPVRRSLATGRPIAWRRVNALPDFVFFDHAIHVRKGVGCESCHGRVDRMTVVYQTAPNSMAWCVDCHRAPERSLRPVERVTEMGWSVPADSQLALGRALTRRYDVRVRTTCTTCHR